MVIPLVMVSVVIPTLKGRENLLKKAIDSVLSQTIKDTEIIVISNDKIDIEYEGRKIKVIVERNANVSEARNMGIKHARGKYIAFLDDDDEWNGVKLEKQIERIESSEDIGLVHTLYSVRYPDGKIVHKRQRCCSGYVYPSIVKRNCIGTSTVLLRREVIKSVGLFDPKLSFAEDWDYWIRVSQEFEVSCVREHLVTYGMPADPTLKYGTYFRRFGAFINKWWDRIDEDSKKRHLLAWMWYGKVSNMISPLWYWRTKLSLVAGIADCGAVKRHLEEIADSSKGP